MTYLRGVNLHATFYTLLTDGPKTMDQMMQATGCCRVSASHFVRLLYSRGAIHIADWSKPRLSKMVPVWALGAGVDKPCAEHCWYPEPLPRARPSLLAFAELIAALQRGPCTRDELAEASGLHFNTVRRALRQWKQDSVIYIADWAPKSHMHDPAFAFGNRRDKQRPAPLRNTAMTRRYRVGARAKQAQVQILNALAANSNHFNLVHRA